LLAARFPLSGHDGAIAQLGERVVRNDEVGGSIPPGSTTFAGYARFGSASPNVAKAAAS
jgi:hypothetical protein